MLNDWLLQLEAALTPARRKIIYRIATAACLILATNGLLAAEEAQSYMQAVALLLGVGVTELAAVNVRE